MGLKNEKGVNDFESYFLCPPVLAAVEAVFYIQHQYKVDFVEAILPQHQVKTAKKLVGFNFFEKAVCPQH